MLSSYTKFLQKRTCNTKDARLDAETGKFEVTSKRHCGRVYGKKCKAIT